ncbi:MAG: insulinase family protein, partial [Oscillospiraceae bacterium]|nr:insulinase family protein [Oscillospiraceae bacterium]
MHKTIVLPNGVRLLCEPVESVRSVTLGIWIATGSRFERAAENGSSHFIEHMLFKGTTFRSAEALARETDALGGQVNAYTTKEYTCFYGRVLDSHLPLLTDILCDMLFHSAFREEDVESERRVIFEEMDMYKDDPEDLVHEQLFLKVYAGHGLARPVLGTEKSLSGLSAESLKDYFSAHYNGS